jgi:metallo-beta-lactamase class B
MMPSRIIGASVMSMVMATVIGTQTAGTQAPASPPQTPPAGAAAPGAQGGAGAPGGGRGRGNYPTPEQWAAMPPSAKAYVDKAKALAGDDPDLQFDVDIFCRASGGASNPDRATIGVPKSEPKLEPFGAPSPAVVVGGQRLFDNFYWIGNTGIGAWLITSNDGYILFDAMNSEEDAVNIIIPGIKKLNLDPMKIKYLVFGHHHFDHTGGGEYIQRMTGAKAIMGRDDWDLYLKSSGRGGGGGRGNAAAAAGAQGATPAPPPPPLPKMKRDIDATDGMTIKVGDVTATIFQMTGHTPGSIGMVVPVKYQGTNHPILLVTAGSDVPNRHSFVGGYEHIWDAAIKMKVESVMQAHPNTNMNLLARTKYVHENYPPKKNPLLYGAERTARYINIVRACTQARLDIFGW